MKRARIILISAIFLLAGFMNSVLASSSVSIGIGVGYYPSYYYSRRHYRPYYYGYYGQYYRPYHWRGCYPYRETVIIDRSDWYHRDRDYCFVDRPLLYQEHKIILNPTPVEKDTQELFRTLRNKKNDLLTQLQTGNARQCREAINELGGFSFDDTVRAALEEVLLTNPDAEMRKLAAEAFGKVRNIKALAALENTRVNDPKEEVRKAADDAIKQIGGAAS